MKTTRCKTSDDLDAVQAEADVFFAERFGAGRARLGRGQAIEYARKAWGLGACVTIAELGAAFDAAVDADEVRGAGTATFRVAYHMAPGSSAGGSSIGARDVSAEMYRADDVRGWARRCFIRLSFPSAA